MPDAPESTTTTTEDGTDTTEQDADDKGGDELGEGGKSAIAKERDARKAAEKAAKDAQKRIDDLAAKVKGFEDRDKSASEKDAERIAELEKALADKDTELSKAALDKLRTKVANREGKHVPVESLTGTTEEELIASADRLIEWRGTGKTPPPNLRQTGPRSGAGAPPDGSNPKQKAAAAIRAMRAGQ